MFIAMVTTAELEPRVVVLGEGASPDGVIIRGEEAEDGGRSSELRPGLAKTPGQLEGAEVTRGFFPVSSADASLYARTHARTAVEVSTKRVTQSPPPV